MAQADRPKENVVDVDVLGLLSQAVDPDSARESRFPAEDPNGAAWVSTE